jgi:aspartyl-tRNA(Asn)/glutamyl-tRNA(Gln) amidotransferase subunit C
MATSQNRENPILVTNMTISRTDVQYVARLARLGLSESEMDQLTSELDHILDAMQALRELDTSAIPPTAQVIPLRNVMRDDASRPSWPVEDILLNAPAARDQQFLVPPVLD